MKLLTLLGLVLSSSSIRVLAISSSDLTDIDSRIVQNKFIVEIASVSRITGNKRSNISPHEHLYSGLKARGIEFQVNQEFHADSLFTGVALTLDSSQEVAALEDIDDIIAIRPVTIHSRPQAVLSQDFAAFKASGSPLDAISSHIMAGVDRVHAEGKTGQGIKIAIIDTGVDYTHPALGGKFGRGNKISQGYDFVGDLYMGPRTTDPAPDGDPLDLCAGHGTHVAGIIGATPGIIPGIRGVAPSASLAMYRVFGCEGSTGDDIIVAALLRAVKDGQDIINLSLGDDKGWSTSTTAVVASRIAAKGTIVIIAAGNIGMAGTFFASSPGSGAEVLTVGSVENTASPIYQATVSGAQRDPIIYYSITPFTRQSPLPIYALSKDTDSLDQACGQLPKGTPSDLRKYVVVVRRGDCGTYSQLANLVASRAETILFFDEGQGLEPIQTYGVNAALISAADGKWLVSKYFSKSSVSLSFPKDARHNYPNPNGGLVSEFSSYGPTYDFLFKPSISAPGGVIPSTWPTNMGSYAVLSGTSMATPFVAGCAALLLQARGKNKLSARSVRTLFETTSRAVYSSKSKDALYQTMAQMGAGSIHVYDAIHATTTISPGELILNDTAFFNDRHDIQVTNTGKSTQKYSVKHIPAGTADSVKAGTFISTLGPVPLNRDSLAVRLSETSFSLRPGRSQTITARFSLPKNNRAAAFPLYSGMIEVSSPNDRVHASYIGLGAALKDRKIFDTESTFLESKTPTLMTDTGVLQPGPKNYTWVDWNSPQVVWSLAFGTSRLRIDLVASDFKLPTKRELSLEEGTAETVVEGDLEVKHDGNRGEKGRPRFTFPKPQPGGSFTQVKTIGPLVESETYGRSVRIGWGGFYSVSFASPTFANGTKIKNGSYRLLLRALRVTGNPSKQDDYESWVSPIVGVYPK